MSIFKSRDELTLGEQVREAFLAFLLIILLIAWALQTGGGWDDPVTMGYAWFFLLMGYVMGTQITYGAADTWRSRLERAVRDATEKPLRESGLNKLTDEEKKALGL